MAFKLLCCDGGGIRGVMTAMLIADLDKHFNVIAKSNGFAGTSTGGLIALALAKGVDIKTILDVYLNDGSTIFTENGWLPRAGSVDAQAQKLLGAGPGYFECQYTDTGLLSVANGLLGSSLLSDATKFVAVNSAQLWNGTSWMAQTLSNAKGNAFAGVSMVDAALATSAAPTYFPPHEIPGYGYFADGGLFANNPTMAAVAELSRIGQSPSGVLAISLGTGISASGIQPSAIPDPLSWGTTTWMWPDASGGVPAMALMNLMFDATEQAATTQAQQFLGGNVVRGNVTLPKPYPLDDWKDVLQLVALANAYMQSSEWQQIRTWVGKNW